ncbi:MAG: hypothetical protein PHR96_04545 [Clostridia bacterium]|nr:hypothetical protein [Clostridia bacterium]
MIKKIADLKGFKQILLIVLLILSFALIKSFNPISIFSVNGIFLSIVFILVYGIFHWLLFEVVAVFFYSALKPKIEKLISMNQFVNILRAFIILSNIIIYLITNLLILINFYTVFLILLFNLAFSFFILTLFYLSIKNNFLKSIADKSFCITFFSFIFLYLLLMTFLWGVL